jgi:hypothetical protein
VSAPTKIRLISDAAVLLGEEPISDLENDDRNSVVIGSNLFDRIYDDELQSNRWRFAVTKKTLSKLAAEPLNEWQAAFLLPSDLLLLIRVYPDHRYEVYGDRIYSNANRLDADYVFRPEVTAVPAYFARMVTYAVARDMARALTESDTTVQDMQDRYLTQRNRALYADAQGRPNIAFSDSPFTDVR